MSYYTSQGFQSEHLRNSSNVEGNSEEAVCEVCQERENSSLLTCKTCLVSVHSACYSANTYKSPWECEKCAYLLANIEEVECCICKRSFGALRKEEEQWVHPACKIWPSYENFSEDQCAVCGDTDGNIIACGICWKSFHPYCGVINGLKLVDWKISCSEHLKVENRVDSKVKNKRTTKKLLADEEKNIKTEDKENEYVELSSKIAKAMNIRKRGPVKETLKIFEDFLFVNSSVNSQGYVLNSNLCTLFGLQEIPFTEISNVFYWLCNN